MNKTIVRILWIAVYLLAIAFSIKKLKEPDTWWQLRTGEWIIENGSVPHTDPLSYTFEGKPWTNIKWGYEVLIATFAKVTSPECIPILQAIISCLIVFFLLKTARLFASKQNHLYEAGAAVILLFLLSAEYRMTGRPEMISHLLSIVYVYLLFRHLQQPSKLIFLLVPLQIVWCNMHEGYGIGLVIVLLFTAASWVVFFNDRSVQKPLQLTLAALLTVVSVVCNPYGIALLLKPFELFKQVESTKFTTEFLDYTSYQYWQKETWLTLAFTIVVVLELMWNVWVTRKQDKNKKAFYTYFFKQQTLHQLILVAAFVVLASSAFRNVVLLSIVVTPFLIAALSQVNSQFLQKHSAKINMALLTITVALYVSVVSQQYYKLTKADNYFGLEVLSISNPDATGDYLESNNLKQNVFSDYLTSSYLLWKLRPEFKSFIDLRDYEVFSPAFFQQYANAIAIPDSFESLNREYHFSAYVCFRQQFATLHKYFYNDSNYSLTHLDAVAAVYEKKPKAKVNYTYASAIPASALSKAVNHLLNPFYKPYNYQGINEDQYVAGYYMMVGDESMARAYIAKALDNKVDLHASYTLYGKLLLDKAFNDTSATGRAMLMDSAQTWFRKAVKANDQYGDAYLGLGEISMQQQLYKEAVKHFEKCVKYAPEQHDGYLFLAQCYKMLANQSKSTEEQYLKLAIGNYEQGNRMNPNNPIIMANLGFLYYRIGNCDKAVPYLEMVEHFPGLSEQERRSIKDCLGRCR